MSFFAQQGTVLIMVTSQKMDIVLLLPKKGLNIALDMSSASIACLRLSWTHQNINRLVRHMMVTITSGSLSYCPRVWVFTVWLRRLLLLQYILKITLHFYTSRIVILCIWITLILNEFKFVIECGSPLLLLKFFGEFDLRMKSDFARF